VVTVAEVSHNTAELERVARNFKQSGIGGEARIDFKTAGLPGDYWPAMAAEDPSREYGQLVDDALRCARLLQETVVAVGAALDGVAKHYRRMEEQHGKEFDGLLD
jgi:hypothetical protein